MCQWKNSPIGYVDEELGINDSDSDEAEEERYRNTDKCKYLATTGS